MGRGDIAPARARTWTGKRAPRAVWDTTYMPMKMVRQVLGARAAWQSNNPWTPDWRAEAQQQQGAYLAMEEARGTQRKHEDAMRLARRLVGNKPLRVTEYAA